MGAIDARTTTVSVIAHRGLVGQTGNAVAADREPHGTLDRLLERGDRQSFHLRRRRRRAIERTHREDHVAVEARAGRRYAPKQRRGAGLGELRQLDAGEARARRDDSDRRVLQRRVAELAAHRALRDQRRAVDESAVRRRARRR